MKIAKKDCENKQKISRESYLIKKKTWRENMEETDIKMSEENNQGIKMEQKAFIFDKQRINKNAFQKK